MKAFNAAPPPGYQLPEYLKKYLRHRNLSYARFSDIPTRHILDAQLDLVFDQMESIMLSPITEKNSALEPVLQQILVTRVGSCLHAQGHYIPRPDGSHEVVMHFCKEGHGWLRNRQGLFQISPGQGFLITPNEPHAYGAAQDNPWSILWIHAKGHLVEQFLKQLDISPSKPVCGLSHFPQLEHLHARIFRELAKRHHLANLISASGKLYDLFAYLLSERQGIEASPASLQLNQAIAYMEAHVHEPLTLKAIARAAGLSVSRFSYLFKEAEGVSPIAWFSQLKMQQAARYLLSSPLSVSETARKMGYDDPYYFSRIFKQTMGKSPREYRKSFRQ